MNILLTIFKYIRQILIGLGLLLLSIFGYCVYKFGSPLINTKSINDSVYEYRLTNNYCQYGIKKSGEIDFFVKKIYNDSSHFIFQLPVISKKNNHIKQEFIYGNHNFAIFKLTDKSNLSSQELDSTLSILKKMEQNIDKLLLEEKNNISKENYETLYSEMQHVKKSIENLSDAKKIQYIIAYAENDNFVIKSTCNLNEYKLTLNDIDYLYSLLKNYDSNDSFIKDNYWPMNNPTITNLYPQYFTYENKVEKVKTFDSNENTIGVLLNKKSSILMYYFYKDNCFITLLPNTKEILEIYNLKNLNSRGLFMSIISLPSTFYQLILDNIIRFTNGTIFSFFIYLFIVSILNSLFIIMERKYTQKLKGRDVEVKILQDKYKKDPLELARHVDNVHSIYTTTELMQKIYGLFLPIIFIFIPVSNVLNNSFHLKGLQLLWIKDITFLDPYSLTNLCGILKFTPWKYINISPSSLFIILIQKLFPTSLTKTMQTPEQSTSFFGIVSQAWIITSILTFLELPIISTILFLLLSLSKNFYEFLLNKIYKDEDNILTIRK